MNNFVFNLPTEMFFGKGYEEKIGSLLSERGLSSVLLVSGGSSAERSGLLSKIRDSLNAASVGFCELSGVVANPLLSKVRDGIALVREKGLQGLLAVGGGSVIDTAKTIAVGVPYSGDVWDFFGPEATAVVKEALPVATVLTIAAAGSETSDSCVITRDEDVLKRSITSDFIRPLFSVLNPENAATLPAHQVACGVADMMAHIMERYFTNTAHVDLTDRMCEGVLRSIVFNAPEVVKDPSDYDAMAEIMFAGSIAHNGLLGLGREEDWASHKIEHELSSKYGVAHGEGLAVIFPSWLRYVLNHHDPVRVARFAHEVFAVDYDYDDFRATAEDGIDALEVFFRNLGLRTRMGEIGASENDVDALAAKTAKSRTTGTIGFFVTLDESAIKEVLRGAF